MAELSTIARPYAQALMDALKDRNAGADEMAQALEAVEAYAQFARDPQAASMVGDPKLTNAQLFDLITGVCGATVSAAAQNLLRVVIENGRVEALPEIATQFRELKLLSEGVADAYIETAFELSQSEIDDLVESLSKKFSGLTLHPVVTVNPELIGGVRVRVGDKLLDGSIRARLSQMKSALTA